MMSEEREAIEYLKSFSGFLTGHLRLGAVGPFNVTALLSAFSERYPSLEVTVKLGNSREMLDSLRNFRVDVAVLAQVEDDPQFHSIPYATHDILAFMRRDHPLAEAAEIDLSALDAHRQVLREPGSTTRRAIDQARARRGIPPPRQVLEMGSREGCWIAVLRGLGIGFVNQGEFIGHEELVTRPIAGPEVSTTDHVVCLDDRRSARIVRAFLEVVAAETARAG